jgi:hypothetical protein
MASSPWKMARFWKPKTAARPGKDAENYPITH